MVNDFSSFKTSFVEVGPQGPQGIPGPQGPQGPQGKDSLEDVGLPQDWKDINDAYEDFGEPGHKLLGGLIYKDFDGKIKVFPLSPAYGVRTDECGKKLAAVAVYNSAQQLLVKPANLAGANSDGRHTVPLRQLDAIFGGGSLSEMSEKACSLQYIPPVDMSNPNVGERSPYVFCRDTENKFAPKYYHEDSRPDTLIERDHYGRALVKAPDAASMVRDTYIVNIDYLNRTLNQRLTSYLPLSGGTITGTTTIQHRNNPLLKLTDTSSGTSFNIQAYQGKAGVGNTWAKSLKIDKNGNTEVVGSLTVGDNISAAPATDGKHTISLRQLDEFFGGGSTDAVGESAFSLQKISPVDLTPPVNERQPYVFCRDSNNNFAGKVYSVTTIPRTLVERDEYGYFQVNYPASEYNPVNLGHLNNPAKLSVGLVGGDEYEIVSCGSILNPTLYIPRFIGDVEIQTIGARAFKNVLGLREVIISPSIRYISTAAFYGCQSLIYVSFDRRSNLHTIGASAFENCYGLKEIELPESLSTIDGDVFYGCSSLINITIPKNVKTIGKNAFANAGLTRVVFEGTEPPTFIAGGMQYNFTAVVPKGTIDAYKAQYALANCKFEEYTI